MDPTCPAPESPVFEELMERGVTASKARDYAEAIDCFSRALEIRVAHYGELSPECVNAFYKYGCALLYKAQEEADPFGAIPKKDAKTLQDSDKDGSTNNVETGETSVASASTTAAEERNSNQEDEVDEGEDNDKEDQSEGDEDDFDLDLAWKMLDLARAIAEKNPADTMEKVDILSALAEVALEREDLETSLSDYHKALAILERIAEPDSRYIAELNFRICLCFELECKTPEATPYCQKAVSICKSRIQRLTEELKAGVVSTSVAPEGANLLSNGIGSGNVAVSEKEAEIKTLSDLLGELEKKLEDLQQLAMNPTSILSEILGLASAKARNGGDNAKSVPAVNSSASWAARSEAPSVSTAHTNGTPGVTNLGVVGRGVKRVTPISFNAESSSVKRPAHEPSADQGDGNSA